MPSCRACEGAPGWGIVKSMRHALPAKLALLALAPLALAAPAMAQNATPAEVVTAAADVEWVAIPPDDILVMELAPAADGSGRYVVIQLLPAPFSQPWVENIRTLAREGWWDGMSVYRVVDNWVAQWGGGEGDGAGLEPKPLPDGIASPTAGYESSLPRDALAGNRQGPVSALLGPLLQRGAGLAGSSALMADLYAPGTLFWEGWPLASDFRNAWPIHCYASVGVARDLDNTGTGSELYAVIGHAPRQLDRNIAVVGRVIEGIEYLATLPRGTGVAGVYQTRAEDTPIVSDRLASEHPRRHTFAYEYLDTASASFARYVDVWANRQDEFYSVPAGGVDICNAPVPVRLVTP